MTAAADPPMQGLSGAQAAAILGVAEVTVSKFVADGVLAKAVRRQHRGLDRADIERLSLDRYKRGHPYWMRTTEVADVLGVNRARVLQLVTRGFLPAVMHDRRWYDRRPSWRSSRTPGGHAGTDRNA
jgi:predicted XRE-type DNA-binding protein